MQLKSFGLVMASAFVMSCVHGPGHKKEVTVQRQPNAETEALIPFDYKEGELTRLCEEGVTSFKAQMEDWRSQSNSHRTEFETLLQFETLLADFNELTNPWMFMSSVSTKKYIRDESTKCEENVSAALNEVYTNRANYELIKDVVTAQPEEARLLKETKFAFEMNGMSLKDDELKLFKSLLDRLSQLSVQFGSNLNNDVSTVTYTEAELKGAKADFLARLKKTSEGLYIVTTKSPDYTHVMENVESSESRKRMSFAYNNRQAEANTPLLQEAIKLRGQIANLLGFPTYADYSLREKMAGNSQNVYQFLNGLKKKLARKNKSELATLAQFKKEELKDSSPFVPWDIAYVSNLLKVKKYNVNDEEVRAYFPARHVVEQTFDVYSTLLGVKFRRLSNAPVWAPNVDLYEIMDVKSQKVIAYFYADLIPREGKYGHAAAFSLVYGRRLKGEEGAYKKPVSAMVANFTPASRDKPSLLTHDEVETFFHEFGHIMHQTLTKAKYASLAGSSVKRDYVEAPSQMLENWVWQKEILKKMSAHHADPAKKLPDDLILRMQKAQLFNAGIQYTRQLVFGFFDMNIHRNPSLDVTQEYATIYEELVGMKPLEGTHFPASFGHVMGGYSAGYYGYLWSKVYAEDMFSVFKKKGILNPVVGAKYRQTILEAGNMMDPLELTKAFLGRNPNNKAFFKSLGL